MTIAFAWRAVTMVAVCTTVVACSFSDIVGKPSAEDSVNTPEAVKSVNGALEFAYGAIEQFAVTVASVTYTSGLLTDELRKGFVGISSSNVPPFDPQNARILPEVNTNKGSDALFPQLQGVRAHAQEAREIFRHYAPVWTSPLAGQMYAIEGMALTMLADLYCSGIPLSTANFGGGFTLGAGTSTENVYKLAISLFDSAIANAGDSIKIKYFASIGKARALVALREYAQAAAFVQDVSVDFRYEARYQPREGSFVTGANGFQRTAESGRYRGKYFAMSDREGTNGLPYVSAGDPRTDTVPGVVQVATSPYPMYAAKKYQNPAGSDPIVVASGIEAQLILAEAALQAEHPTEWLTILNTLRTTCDSIEGCPVPAPAGTGGIAGLPPLEDPGLEALPPGSTAFDVRVDLLFHERAFWLFLTGHRQGDLRRLIRNYGRTQETVYPIGELLLFRMGEPSAYGTDVNLPIPGDERLGNPLFRGCFNREA